MIQGEYQKILLEVFDVLELTEEERSKTLDGFKRKLATDLLSLTGDALSEEQRQWLDKKAALATPDDPKLLEIQVAIKEKYSIEELIEKSRPLFKVMLEDYVAFMSKDLSAEKIGRLEKIIELF